jgi:hypothetical protein
MVLLCYDAGESRRGAVLLRPFGGRDQPSRRLRHGRQDRAPTFRLRRSRARFLRVRRPRAEAIYMHRRMRTVGSC